MNYRVYTFRCSCIDDGVCLTCSLRSTYAKLMGSQIIRYTVVRGVANPELEGVFPSWPPLPRRGWL